MPPIRRFFRIACLTFVLVCGQAVAAEPQRLTLSFKLGGAHVEGMPLSWTNDNMFLLSREGRLYQFNPADAAEPRKASSTFRGYSAAEMRDRLTKELGNAFEVTHTGHYLVAHPKGRKNDWAPRFEEMYRQFTHYFTVRGLAPREPEFPLVAIVWPTQADFQRYAAAEGSPMGAGYLGYYSAKSNRVTLYDQRDGGNGSTADNFDTIVHEVTHQTAYNTGIHRRFADVPRWLVEGLGTMFEARGVYDGRRYTGRDDRVNRGRLLDFQARASQWKQGHLAEMIASDRLFESDPIGAYCEAWAFSFYLGEKMPKKYGEYLALTANRPTFTTYTSAERLQDFNKVFGTDLRLLEAQFLRFMAEWK